MNKGRGLYTIKIAKILIIKCPHFSAMLGAFKKLSPTIWKQLKMIRKFSM